MSLWFLNRTLSLPSSPHCSTLDDIFSNIESYIYSTTVQNLLLCICEGPLPSSTFIRFSQTHVSGWSLVSGSKEIVHVLLILLSFLGQVFDSGVDIYLINKNKQIQKNWRVHLFIDELKLKSHLLKITKKYMAGTRYNLKMVHGFVY